MFNMGPNVLQQIPLYVQRCSHFRSEEVKLRSNISRGMERLSFGIYISELLIRKCILQLRNLVILVSHPLSGTRSPFLSITRHLRETFRTVARTATIWDSSRHSMGRKGGEPAPKSPAPPLAPRKLNKHNRNKDWSP